MRYIGWLIAGFAFYKLSGLFESFGDASPIADSGISGERAMWHGAALVVLLAGLACFVRVLLLAWRSLKGGGGGPKQVPEPTAVSAAAAAEAEFDPDAALARYLASRETGPMAGTPSPRQPGGFGRRGL